MYEINKNPPGVSYFIALAASIVGWGEIALHAIFLAPLLALSAGTYLLAGELRPPGSSEPNRMLATVATLAAMVSPAILVSSSNVIADTLTLALYTWAL
jgi:hypothetical protein